MISYLVIHCVKNMSNLQKYSDIIHPDGYLQQVNGHFGNIDDPWATDLLGNIVHVAYIGGYNDKNLPENTLTCTQYDSLEAYISYNILRNPSIKVLGYNELSDSTSPSFNVQEFVKDIPVAKSKNKYNGKKLYSSEKK